MRPLLAFLLVLSGLLVPGPDALAAETGRLAPAYVGSQACAGCHAESAKAWKDSHHAWAWKPPEGAAVLGDFDDARFAHDGVTTRFSTRDGRYVIETEGPDGVPKAFEVQGTAGIAPLQQYLLETEPGRLQAFDLAWDRERERWFHLYPDQRAGAGDGLHWTGPYKTWNARCAECHATGYAKNYDPKARRYASRQAEIGVGCEACHGPGEAHVAWAQAPEGATRRPGLTDTGLIIDFAVESPETEIQLCAGCHARREPLGDGNPLPGTAFHDAYRLALLREGLYHADGAIRDEVYVYGSFLQSKMYARGLRCTDCHDPHRAGLKVAGNAVCTQCHAPAGNPRFPSLRSASYDDPAHHFHEAGSEAARCVSCHMIERVYMGIDGRRDHGFRIPRPDLSAETGAPDACTDCHGERDAAWAAAEIARRYPESARPGAHFSTAFAAARTDPAKVAEDLLAIALEADQPGIVRASALDLLSPVAEAALARRAAPLIGDADPLVRAASIPVQRSAPPAERVRRLVPALEDPLRSVRIAAARELLSAPAASLPPGRVSALQKAMGEWRASLLAKADFPETQMAIGGVALVLRNPRAALEAFREAARLDPQLLDARVMIVRILAATGDLAGADAALKDALAVAPEDEALRALRAELDRRRGR